MISISNLPITYLSKQNFEEQISSLYDAISDSTLIALDLEMSGLGNRRDLISNSIEDRYKFMVKLASSFSVVSLGISCFKLSNTASDSIDKSSKSIINVENRTFNLLTICTRDFLVEPDSIRFLIKHGLDVNKLFTEGIEYYKGNDQTTKTDKKKCPRDVISKIISSNVPIVVHNGLVDLVFIYQNFYADAPDSLMKFVADMSDMFKAGIFDTKFISEYHDHPSASFLEFLYRKALYENSKREKKISLGVSFGISNSNDPQQRLAECDLEKFSRIISNMSIFRDKKYLSQTICETFASFGFCSKNDSCERSHNIEMLIGVEICKSSPKPDPTKGVVEHDASLKTEFEETRLQRFLAREVSSVVHNAGIDAFMTGYTLLHYLIKFKKLSSSPGTSSTASLEASELEDFNFKIYLIGKDYPLIIRKSNFASHSSNHQAKKLKTQLSTDSLK